MGRGPYEKAGLVEDTSLAPLKTVTTLHEIFFPVKIEDVKGKKTTTVTSDTLDVDVKLWYMPFGTLDDAVLWKEFKKQVSISTQGT